MAWAQGLAGRHRSTDLEGEIAAYQFDPAYPQFVPTVLGEARD